jgi:D-hydroxyproline dehydrogenase subunit alpha
MAYDVAVIGAGVAGLSAARAAARCGARTVCVDAYPLPGGQYLRQPAGPEAKPSRLQRRGRALADSAIAAGVHWVPGTTVWALSDGVLETIRGDVRETIRTRAVVIAAGTYERVAPFPGWTLPGVMTAGGVQAQLKAYGQAPGSRAVIAGSGPLTLVVAGTLAAHGVRVAAVLESGRPVRRGLAAPLSTVAAMAGQPARLAEATRHLAVLARRGVRPRTGWGVVRAHGTSGVEAVTIARFSPSGTPLPDTGKVVPCDLVGVHNGLRPATELYQLVGAELVRRPSLGGWVPIRTETFQTTVDGVFAAGDGAGIGGATLAAVEGEIAGRAAAAHALDRPVTVTRGQRRRLANARRFQALYARCYPPGPGLSTLADPDTVLCRCESVTHQQLLAAVERGATTHAAVKSLTRCGMGNCQGAVCSPVISDLLGDTAAGSPAARPPLHPLPLAALIEEHT